MSARARLSWACWTLAIGACASGPSAYEQALERANQAERRHDYVLARGELQSAADQAPSTRTRDEALYRFASVAKQEGDAARAAHEMLAFAHAHPKSERAARALLDAGRAFERAGDGADARAAYAELLKKHPSSGGTMSAAQRYVELSPGTAPSEWQKLIAENSDRELDAGLRYAWARSLESNDPRAALLVYEDVARRDPLPQGTHSDEALLRAAELRRQLGDPEGALATLAVLREARSFSYLAGSYERSAFARARFLEGQIQRDDLHRPSDAAHTFELLISEHPLSRLVDDALFEQAWSLALDHRVEHACQLLERLAKEHPDSPWRMCAPLYCVEQAGPIEPRCCRSFSATSRPTACR